MSAVTEAITAAVLGRIQNQDGVSEAKMVSMYFDQQQSSYERHAYSGCEACAKAPSGQCKLADKLEQLFDKVYLSK